MRFAVVNRDVAGGAELRAYYEREAELGTRTELRGRRIDLRNGFVALLASERRHSLVDFGAGPGLDGVGFTEAGLRFVGLDLAVGNAHLARQQSVAVVPGSITAPPFRPRSFAAGWSMSTLMHLPPDVAAVAVGTMAAALQVDAPLQIGTWGGPNRIEVEYSTIDGHQRPFHLRPLEDNRQLVAAAGSVESIDAWDVGPDEWEYHVFRVRIERAEMEGASAMV